MKKITELLQYRNIIAGWRNKGQYLLSNNMFSNRAIQGFIDDGRFFYQVYDEGIVFFIDNDTYYNILYYILKGGPFPDITVDRPLLIEEIDKNQIREKEIENMSNLVRERGFVIRRLNREIVVPLENRSEIDRIYRENHDRINAMGLHTEICDGRYQDQVIALWRLQLADIDFPYSHYFYHKVREQKVICILNDAGEVCASEWWKNAEKGKTSEGRHTVTHPDYYRKGLAKACIYYWLKDATGSGCKHAYSWIDADNIKSQNLHFSIGFTYSGKTSLQLVKK